MTDKKYKALLIGDLVDAHNYGAIATTTCFIKKLEDYFYIFHRINFRSLYNPTPDEGWEEFFRKQKEKQESVRREREWVDAEKNTAELIEKKKTQSKNRVKQKLIRIVFSPFKVILWPLRKIITLYFRLRDKEFVVLSRNETQKPILPDPIFPKLRRKDFVPFRWDQYELYAREVMHGLRMQYEYKLLQEADLIIINGEGNVVSGTDEFGLYRCGARYIFFMAYLAKKYFKKYVCIVNHTIDPKNKEAEEIIKHVYPLFDFVSCREKLSFDILKPLVPDLKPRFHGDSLFTFEGNKELINEEIANLIDFSKPFICIGDSSGVRGLLSQVKWNVVETFAELITEINKIIPQVVFIDGYAGNYAEINRLVEYMNIPCLNLRNCCFEDLIYVLSKSSCFVSGRWHASIMALLGNCPVVLWGADSHKTRALYHLFNENELGFYSIDSIPIRIHDIVSDVRKAIERQKDYTGIVQNLKESANNLFRDVYNDFEKSRK